MGVFMDARPPLGKPHMESNLEQAAAHLNLGVARKAAGDLDGALSGMLRALELVPGWPEARYNLGNLLVARGDFPGAASAYRRALDARPDWPQAWNALGTALRQAGDLAGSLEAHRQAIALAPDWSAAHHNLAVALQRLDREVEAEEGFRQAIERDPEADESHVSLGLLLLKQGDFAAGWREFEWRFANGGVPAKLGGRPQPVWQGEPLAGRTLLVCAEQGSGAQIQFLRFVPKLAELGGRIFVEAPSNLARLFASCPGIVPLGEPCDEADLQIPLLSVPRVLGTTLETLPAEIPYLSAPTEPRPDLDAALSPYRDDFKIGIAWSGNPLHCLNPDRSCSPADFAVLGDLPGMRLFSLQYGDQYAQGITSLAGSLGDFASTAAVMERMDLILTVDTYTAHLAGALGRPVWTLLHTPCDWRWMAGQDDTPWYPGMRLFRQPSPGDWPGVFQQVRAALADRNG
jgi:tetratricopeptide (TPR) repeat protein